MGGLGVRVFGRAARSFLRSLKGEVKTGLEELEGSGFRFGELLFFLRMTGGLNPNSHLLASNTTGDTVTAAFHRPPSRCHNRVSSDGP